MSQHPMENFIFTLNAVVPMFVSAGVGALLRTCGLLSRETARQLNTLCFRLLIPCSLFATAYSSNFVENFSGKLIGYAAASFLVGIALLWLVIPRFVPNRGQAGAMVHGAFRSNTVLFGLALAVNFFGEEGSVPMALLVATLIPLFNVMGVIVLSFFSEREYCKPSAKKILHDIATNPLIIAALLGLVLPLFSIELPTVVIRPIRDLAACGTPMAMLALGAQFDMKSAVGNLKLSLPTVFIKLVVMPVCATAVAILLGFRGPELGAIFIVHAAPAAATSAMMAQTMGCDGELGGEIILFSTFFSMFTIFAGALLLKNLGLF